MSSHDVSSWTNEDEVIAHGVFLFETLMRVHRIILEMHQLV